MSLIELCCTHGIHTLNERIFDDKNGDITCVANDGSSVVDYMLASTSLFNSILYFQVAFEDFSDHFPLQCRLLLSYESENDQSFESDLNENNWIKYKWKEESKTQFIQIFSTLFSSFKDKVTGTNESIINCLPEFINTCIYKMAGECMTVKSKNAKCINKQPPWWDNECQLAKSNNYVLLREFRRTDGRMDLHNYKAAKARFKNFLQIKTFAF